MEGNHARKDLIEPRDWLAKVDLKDAFFTIPNHPPQRSCLRFTFQAFSSMDFTKTLKPVIAHLRELGVWLIAYIDDRQSPSYRQNTKTPRSSTVASAAMHLVNHKLGTSTGYVGLQKQTSSTHWNLTGKQYGTKLAMARKESKTMEHSMTSLEEQVRSKEELIKTLNAELRVYKERQDILTKLDKEIDKLSDKNKGD